MAIDEVDLRAVSLSNSAIRRAFDTSIPKTSSTITPDELHRQYIAFESVRYKFDQERRSIRRRDALEPADYTSVFRSYAEGLAGLEGDPEFERVTHRLNLRPMPSSRDPIPVELSEIFDREEGKASVYEAVRLLQDFAFNRVVDGSISGRGRLDELLPEQKVAPLRFDVHNDRLVLAQHTSTPSDAGAAVASIAKQELIARGLDVIQQLESSNCDRRLLGALQELQENLETSENVIKTGLSNLACEVMHKVFENELPDAVSAALQVQTMGVGMYLAQFPEWIQFSEAAAGSPIDQRAEAAVVAALDSVIAATEDSPELADPEVPQTLRHLRELVIDPQRASKRAIYAAIRSVENLVIKAFSYGSSFLHETITKTSGLLSTTVSRAAAVALLSLGLSAASGLLPISTTMEGLGWVREAVVVVQREMISIGK